MTLISRETLETLARHHAWPSVTIYLPTHVAGPDKEQDRIRLKNLVREASEELASRGMRSPDAEAFLSPLNAVLDDGSFWREGHRGLALFVSQDHTLSLRLDVPVPDQAVVGDRYHLRPLLAAHPGERPFLALAIDRNGSRLFRGDAASIAEVPLDGVPTSLADELRYDEAQEAVQYSSVPAPAQAMGGGRATGAIFHGHGGEKDTDKSNLERYLRKIEGAVSAYARTEPEVPLVIMGVEYALALYRSLNTSPALAPEQITGATDEFAPYEVREKSLAALEPRFEARTERRLAALTESRGAGLFLDDPEAILVAAASGRVHTIFFDDDTGPFGTLDPDGLVLGALSKERPDTLCSFPPPETPGIDGCGWDLVDLAAAQTLLHGGDIVAFTGENPPVQGVAAMLRY